MTSARAAGAALALACALLLASGPRLLLEMGRLQNRLAGRAADPVVCSHLARTGKPCLGCGGTRALGLAARGRLLDSLAANPLGAWAGLVLWGGVGIGARATRTGRWPAALPLLAGLLGSGALSFCAALFWWWRVIAL